MAEIIPFKALRYDPDQVKLEDVLTQPYDKITPAMQERYYDANRYNLVRIILGRTEPSDNRTFNVYVRAARYARDFRQAWILRFDQDPSIYSYSQTFTTPSGDKMERRGCIALGRIEDYAAKVVFRHEQTLAKPKADRLELLRATRTHFEQLFLLYEDSGEVANLLEPQSLPTIEVADEYGVEHRVWKISDPGVISAVQRNMRDKKLVIADGHHRYETALNYRNERRAIAANQDPQAPYEYVMMTFVNMNDPGLVILPTHRVVHSLPSFSVEIFLSAILSFFQIEEIENGHDAPNATALLRERGHQSTALLAITAGRTFLLHSPKPEAAKFFAGLSNKEAARTLGISEATVERRWSVAKVRLLQMIRASSQAPNAGPS